MNVNDIYVFGDSWSSAVNSDTLRDREGWPQMLGIPEANNLAVAGSTAIDWATTLAPRLTAIPQGKIIAFTLGGNDVIKAISDRRIDPREIMDVAEAYSDIIDRMVELRPAKLLVLAYQNPHPGLPEAEAAVQIMHSLQALVLITMEDVLKSVGCEILTPFYLLKGDDFSQGDIHPNTVGHRQIAEAIKERL